MDTAINLPDPPEKPLSSDCCGNGCTPCILDIYEQDLRIWQLECQALQRGAIELSANPTDDSQAWVLLKQDEYNKFPIISVFRESNDSFRFKLSLQPTQTLGLAVGQHVIIRSASLTGTTLTRQFTPVSPVNAKGYFELLIKVYSDGRMSRYIKDWKVGDHIAIRGPFGNIEYKPNKYDLVLMLCAGTGIAPMCQVIHSILENEEDETRIRLLYACQTYEGILARSELDEWQRYWNFSSLFVLSREPQEPCYSYKYGDTIHKGRIDKSILYSELVDKRDKTYVLICGTSSFDADMLIYLEELGVNQSQIHTF